MFVSTVFNLTFKPIFQQGPHYSSVRMWNKARIRSWSEPVLSNEGKVSCLMKQRNPFTLPTEHATRLSKLLHSRVDLKSAGIIVKQTESHARLTCELVIMPLLVRFNCFMAV